MRDFVVGEMAEQSGEMVRLTALVSGEVRVEDIPLSPSVNLQALKAGDQDPLEVVVEVPAGKSKRGWDYRPEALQKIVGEVMQSGLPGFLGHQKPENVDTEFPTPVTHWVGALWQNGRAYFRGVVDAAASDLKRWVRAKTIRQVSIFGAPKLQTVSGEVHVVDYRPLSIDWTPLNRAGMPTSVVATGEMDAITGNMPPRDGGAGSMNLKELLAKLRELGVRPSQVVGEMGWKVEEIAKELGVKLEDLAKAIAGEQWSALQEQVQLVGEMAKLLGLAEGAKPADVLTAVKAARETQLKAATADRDKLVDKVIGEMVVAEAARPIVRRMIQVPDGADEAKLKQVVGELLQQDDVKKALAGVFHQDVIRTQDPGRGDPPAGLRARRVAI